MAVRWQRIKPAEEAKTEDQITCKGVDRDHALGLQLAERNMNAPMIQVGGVEAIQGKIDGFADAHAGVSKQEEEVRAQIVAAAQFLLEQLIVFGREGAWQAVWTTRNVLAAEQLSQLRPMCSPGQLSEDAAHENEPEDIGNRSQRWQVGAQCAHPAEKVRIASQLIERNDLGMMSAEPDEEVAGGAAILTRRFGRERDAQRIDCGIEQRSQRMEAGSPTRGGHVVVTGTGRIS